MRAAIVALLSWSLLTACGTLLPTEPSTPRALPMPASGTSSPPPTAAPTVSGPAAPGTTVPGPSAIAGSVGAGPNIPPGAHGTSPSRPVHVHDTALVETSGLAVSRRDDGVLWAINDGGNAPVLHALAFDGRPLGRWPLDIGNRDWEDLAAFRLDGEPYLLIADTGDNGRRRDEITLHLVAEPAARGPDATPGAVLVPSRSLRVRYEDGPHDVEAVAVDESSRTVWLLSKEPAVEGRGVAGGAYTLSLPDRDDDVPVDEPLVARRATTLAEVSRGFVERIAASVTGIDLEQPTAFDIAADGRSACLLTYRRVRCLERADGEDWSEALARPGTALPPHGLDQAEALALSADGTTLVLTSEGVLPPLRFRRRVLPQP